jgi:hypothetical protein
VPRYECWTSTELDKELQKVATSLRKKGLLSAKNDSTGKSFVPRYRITLFALRELVNGNSRVGRRTKPSETGQSVEEPDQ